MEGQFIERQPSSSLSSPEGQKGHEASGPPPTSIEGTTESRKRWHAWQIAWPHFMNSASSKQPRKQQVPGVPSVSIFFLLLSIPPSSPSITFFFSFRVLGLYPLRPGNPRKKVFLQKKKLKGKKKTKTFFFYFDILGRASPSAACNLLITLERLQEEIWVILLKAAFLGKHPYLAPGSIWLLRRRKAAAKVLG